MNLPSGSPVEKTRVTMVDDRSFYSKSLFDGFEKARIDRLELAFFSPKDGSESKQRLSCSFPNEKKVWTSYFYPFQIFGQVMRYKPDVVHVQYEFTTFGSFLSNFLFPFLLILLKIARSKVATTVHSVIPKENVDAEFVQKSLPQIARFKGREHLLRIALFILYKTIAISSDAIIVHGKWYKKKLVESYGAVPCRIQVIPYGVDDTQSLDIDSLNRWKEQITQRKVVLFFGHVSPRKDIETLLKAFALFSRKNPEYLLLIAGRSPPYYADYMNKLKSMVNQLDLSDRVVFTGYLGDEEIHVLFALSEFVVFPYVYAFEGPSGPLAFAIQHHVPLIGNNVGNLQEEIIHMEEGVLVPPMNTSALEEAMEMLANDKALRTKFARNIGTKMSTRLWKNIAWMTFQVYKELLVHEGR